jgi:cytochrome c-type biogenesis protein CcmH/NrfF
MKSPIKKLLIAGGFIFLLGLSSATMWTSPSFLILIGSSAVLIYNTLTRRRKTSCQTQMITRNTLEGI